MVAAPWLAAKAHTRVSFVSGKLDLVRVQLEVRQILTRVNRLGNIC